LALELRDLPLNRSFSASRRDTSPHNPSSPATPFVESFHARVRDELLDVEARVVIGDWHQDYNHQRAHSALGMLAPAVSAASVSLAAAAGV
jgi:transposase InsO family protein